MTPVNIIQQNKSKKTYTEQSAVPDSTTQVEKEMPHFSVGQDVLVKQKDERYYFGTVIQVNSIREQCLVKYGDNTYNWSSYKDLTRLSTSEQEESLCVICKKSTPKIKKDISICDQCGRGYHRKCHQPEIPLHTEVEDSTWKCKRCTENDSHQRKRSESKQRRDSLKNVSSSTTDSFTSRTPIKTLPYDLNSLNWDTYHRVNSDQIYCYCGGNGDWYNQMLQCGRCRQWFHERCLDCLKYPLFCGDRFYVFVCSICNQGKHFLRRLEMKWVDLVHLMLYNLTSYNNKKYYDLDSVIIPYINDNWHILQLPPKIANVSKIERRENILSVLTNNRNRFKCGREIKKRTTIWGLRVKLPPPAPCVTLPIAGQVREDELREMWQGIRRLQFLPAENSLKLFFDSNTRNLMMGVAYQRNSTHSDSDSPCSSPETVCEEPFLDLNTVETIQRNKYLGAGIAKKSVPFKKMCLQRRKKLLTMSSRERDRILRRPKRRVVIESMKIKSDKEACSENRKGEILPPTPPTSVSAPPTPPTSHSTSAASDLSNDFPDNTSVKAEMTMKKTHLLELASELNTPYDTSGDETSSKSTLDQIIPRPKDFEGKNNPFLTLLRAASNDSQFVKKKNKEITLPLPLTAVIQGKTLMRPMKRQLSEKDIIITPNGQVKRKRFRRNKNVNLSYIGGQTASKTTAIVPVRPDAKEWEQRNSQPKSSSIGNCMDYALNGRRLRQRPEKIQENEKVPSPSTSKSSQVKQENDINMQDLKTSVNIYFGAANRIATGEKFFVKAKRIGPTGKVDYLIEWEGSSNGMT